MSFFTRHRKQWADWRRSMGRSQRRCAVRLQVEALDDRTVPAVLAPSPAVGGFATAVTLHWADSPSSSDAGQQNGVDPQYMIALATELHADAWTNMPKMSNDDYVRHPGLKVADMLKPNGIAQMAEASGHGIALASRKR